MFSSPDAEVCCRPDDRASKKKDTEATSKDPAAVNKPVRVGFRAVYVFDVAQTEGAELPAFTERTKGDVGEYRERLIDFTIA